MSPKNKGKFGKGKSVIQEEDEFVSSMHKLGRQLKPYATKLAIGTGIITVMLIALFTYRWWNERQARQATVLYAEALALSQRVIIPPSQDQPTETPDADPTAPAADEPPSFPSGKARAEAVLAPLERLRRDYGGTDAARGARLLHAQTLLTLGKPDEAIGLYQAARASATDPGLRFIAQQGIGYGHEARAAALEDAAARQSALEQALAAFQQIQPAEEGPYKDYALYHEARILVALDRRDDAAAALAKAAEIDGSQLGYDIATRRSLLAGAAAE